MLRGKAEVHRLAISKVSGRATFNVPIAQDGMVMHFAGSLDDVHVRLFRQVRRYEVVLRTLDEMAFTDVRFIKVDVEGTERDVLDGARNIIMRDRPAMVLELLSGTHSDPSAATKGICADFGYEAVLVTRNGRVPAMPAIAALGKNTTWGTDIETRNVLFLPQ
jgi:FkbM family methyltransferase